MGEQAEVLPLALAPLLSTPRGRLASIIRGSLLHAFNNLIARPQDQQRTTLHARRQHLHPVIHIRARHPGLLPDTAAP